VSSASAVGRKRCAVKGLAGMALVGLFVAGCPLEADADAVTVRIAIDAKCNSEIDKKARVRHSKRDVLVWSFGSSCPRLQQVHVCPTGRTPLRNCKGDPESAKVGKKFRIGAAATTPINATVMCTVDWSVLDANRSKRLPFYFRLVTGDADSKLECPGRCQPKPESDEGGRFGAPPVDEGPDEEARPIPCPRSELALEVEP
jgi:hypothetical protein